MYACVRIPIELTENGHHITYNDHAKIEFEKCDELPPKSNLGKFKFADIFEKMSQPDPAPASQQPLTQQHQPPVPSSSHLSSVDPVVLQSEIKTSKPPMKNSSFKNRQSTSSSKYSQKNRY
jgi:hypothetical protein